VLIQLETQSWKPRPRSIFYSYSHKDETLRDELDRHLTSLKRDGFISTWHDRKIFPGDEFDHAIDKNLNEADIILLLISHDFLSSQYCRDVEVQRALERSRNGEAILIPVILRACAWTLEPFSKYQALPRNCRPLEEWREQGFPEVAEELRNILVEALYPQKPLENAEGQHGSWLLKLRKTPSVNPQEIVERLREYTKDFTIHLVATANTQVTAREQRPLGPTFVLTGTPAAFSAIDKAQREGRLSEAIEVDVASFYGFYGAAVQGSSIVNASLSVYEHQEHDDLLSPGRKFSPSNIVAIYLPEDETGELRFIFDRGDKIMDDEATKREFDQLTNYFYTALAIKNEHHWVNLSAYESERMLAKELTGTSMGYNLLAQDYLLKRLVASFMHPDSPIGREYWDAVYSEARSLTGTSSFPFRSFQKVWITPTTGSVYMGGADMWRDHPSIGGLAPPPGYRGAFLINMVLDIHCDEDLVAAKHNLAPSRRRYSVNRSELGGDDFTVGLFRKIILPKIKEEVMEGEHFAEIRRIYSAAVLATWLKKEKHLTRNDEIKRLIDSSDLSRSMKVTSISPIALESKNNVTFERKVSHNMIESSNPTTDLQVPENVEFFEKYVRLFKNGLFRCARREKGDSEGESVIRVYSSGAIDLRCLN
jgi:hypothetical protein